MRKTIITQLVLLFFCTNLLTAAEVLFPVDIECVPQAVYRYRKDGKPGREVIVKLKESALSGKVFVDITVNGKTETTKYAPKEGGYTELSVLLPDQIGVNSESEVTLTVRQDNNKVTKTITVPVMRHWNIYLYNHAHVDIGYTNTHKNVELLHKNNILEGIKLAEATKKYPDGARYLWNPEVTWPLERLWKSNPEEQKNLLKAIGDGSLCIDANYLNLNTSVCSDEELFHIFDFSRKMEKLTGKPMDVFQQMDIPGMSWGLVPVMAQQGVRYIMSWPNSDRAGFAHKDIDKMPFWWVAPDGKAKVLFFQPGGYANSGSMGKGGDTGRPWFGQRNADKVPLVIKTGNANVNFTNQVTEMEKAAYPYDFLVLSWTLWDNCPLDADVPDAVKAWNETYAYPHIIIAGGHEIMEMIDKKYGDKLPVVKGDFTEYWTDGLGTAAGLTAMNRNAKEQLTQAESLWTMLRPGKPAPRNEFDEAWRYIMLGSEHTWCFENPTEPFFQEAIWKVKQSYFHEASNRSQVLLDDALAPATDRSLGALGPAEGPAKGGVAVLNTHSWQHGGLVTLSQAESRLGNRVVDEQDVEVPSQRLSTGELVFLASDVPALGSRHYRVEQGEPSLTDGCKLNGTTLENDFLRVVVDPLTGNISKLIKLAGGRNYADESVNGGLNAFRWLPANVYEPKADSCIVITTVESGPLVQELRVSSKAVGCRAVSRSVRLVQGQPWVEIENVVDKLPLVAKDGIHFGFGFNIPDSKTRVDIPWGVMEVEKDQWPQGNRNWLALQRWLDVSNTQSGITWCSLDAALFEYGKMTANIAMGWGGKGPWVDKLEPSSTIYSWVMNNHWHTNFPVTQDGPVKFRYHMLPHDGYDVVQANRFGLEQSQPLVHVPADKNPQVTPVVAINNHKVYITILKPTENGGAAIIRLRSLSDTTEVVNLTFPGGIPKSVHLCEFDEDATTPVTNSITLLPYGMATLKVQY